MRCGRSVARGRPGQRNTGDRVCGQIFKLGSMFQRRRDFDPEIEQARQSPADPALADLIVKRWQLTRAQILSMPSMDESELRDLSRALDAAGYTHPLRDPYWPGRGRRKEVMWTFTYPKYCGAYTVASLWRFEAEEDAKPTSQDVYLVRSTSADRARAIS